MNRKVKIVIYIILIISVILLIPLINLLFVIVKANSHAGKLLKIT